MIAYTVISLKKGGDMNQAQQILQKLFDWEFQMFGHEAVYVGDQVRIVIAREEEGKEYADQELFVAGGEAELKQLLASLPVWALEQEIPFEVDFISNRSYFATAKFYDLLPHTVFIFVKHAA